MLHADQVRRGPVVRRLRGPGNSLRDGGQALDARADGVQIRVAGRASAALGLRFLQAPSAAGLLDLGPIQSASDPLASRVGDCGLLAPSRCRSAGYQPIWGCPGTPPTVRFRLGLNQTVTGNPDRFEGVAEHLWRHAKRGNRRTTVIIDLTPRTPPDGPVRLPVVLED